jgi:hypothetical protein
MTQREASDTLDRLKSRLERRSIPFEPIHGGLRVPAASDTGFDVSISIDGDGCHVALGGGWHEEFEDYDDGLNCFVWSLSSAARLAVTRRGFDHKWTLQSRRGDSWQDGSTTGLLFFPYFLRGHTRYLQNEWWDGDVAKLG